ncbi:MAG: hypothetical protein CFE29_03555 [Bradyrhizobiaceae bacterium PARB1]|jgi:hypothetical protein|nr:MAG: hypothetical protein CFE29_03555 [Bradyrhizobiaceae bacterium PARB1]
MLALIVGGIYLAIFLWFSLLGYIAQSLVWRSIGMKQANGDLSSAPLINPKYLEGDDACQHTTLATTASTGARLGWSLLIGVVWSTGFWLISSYLYRFDLSRSAGSDGFLISTGSLVGAALLTNMVLRATRHHRAYE